MLCRLITDLSLLNTFKYLLKEIYLPDLFNISSPESWIKAGKKEIHETAREQALKIRKEYEPTPLPTDIQNKLSEIVKERTNSAIYFFKEYRCSGRDYYHFTRC